MKLLSIFAGFLQLLGKLFGFVNRNTHNSIKLLYCLWYIHKLNINLQKDPETIIIFRFHCNTGHTILKS